MADDINRIGKGRGRSMIEAAYRLGDPERSTQKMNQLGQREAEIRDDPVFDMVQKDPSMLGWDPTVDKEYRKKQRALNSIVRQQDILEESRAGRVSSSAMSGVNQIFSRSAINGEAQRMSSSISVQHEALRRANEESAEQYQRKLRASELRSDRLQGKAANIAQNTLSDSFGNVNPGEREKLDNILARQVKEVESRSVLTAQGKIYKARGQDYESIQDRRVQTEQAALSAGQRGGPGAKEGEDFIKAFKELAAITDTLSDEFKKLSPAVDAAEERFKKAAAGAGGSSGWNNAANALSFASNTFNTAGSAISQIQVGQRLAQVNNIAGYAGIENQKYQTYKAAAGGDVASQLALSQFNGAEEFGRSQRTWANVAVGAQTAGAVAQGAVGGIKAYASGGLLGGGDIVQGAANAAIGAGDLVRDVSGSGAAIQGVNAQMEARRQLSMVSANQLQGLRDFGVGLGSAAIGMGGKGAGFVDRMTNKPNLVGLSALERMESSRISPEQMAQMAEIGVQQMGSTFNENQIFGARGLERSGFGTMGENMQRMSSLAAAGTNNPQSSLSGVLEAAVSKGMDSSKAISIMVDNTANMAKQSFAAAGGLDITGAAATVLSANIDPKSGNQEFAAERAMTAQQVARDITTNTDVSFSGMTNTSRISKKTGLGGDDAIFAAKLSTEELKALQGKSESEVKDYMFQKGINPNNSNLKPKELVNTLLDTSRMTLFEGKGAGFTFGSDKLRTSISENAENNVPWNKLSDDEKAFAGKLGAGRDITGKEFYGTGLGIGAKNDPNAAGKVKGLEAGQGGSDQQKMLDDMRTQGFKQLSQAAMEATKEFKTAADALKALGALAKNVENFGDQGGEGKSKIAAADSAGTFGASTLKFERSVEAFSRAIVTMNTKSGISNADDRLMENLKRDSTKAGLEK